MNKDTMRKAPREKMKAIEELLIAVGKLPPENTYQVLGYAQGMAAGQVKKVEKVN